MQENRERRESGQTLVIVALTITVLMLMAGLAVDVGMAYNERRNMQNAADAAALAGAQKLCDMQGTSAALSAANSVGTINGATTLTATLEADDTRVRAIASIDSETFFFRILDIDSVPVSATAVAECGCAASLGGAWPILFDDDTWFNDIACMNANGTVTPSDKSPHFLVWADGNADTYVDQDLCTICNCEPITAATGVTSVVAFGGNPFTSGNRGWAQLGSPDGDLANDELEGLQCNGANTLKTWMYWGYPGLIDEGACISTEKGDVASALGEGLEAYTDNLLRDVNILLFDHDDETCEIAEATFEDCADAEMLRIAGTGAVHIERIYLQSPPDYSQLTLKNLIDNPFSAACEAARTECEADPLSVQCKNKTNLCLNADCDLDSTAVTNRKAVLVTRLCYTIYSGSGTSGGELDPTCVQAVSLVE